MKKFLLPRTLFCVAFLFISAYSLHAQAVTDGRNKADVGAANEVAVTPANEQPVLGKEMPVPGGVLFVTPAERASMQKEISTKEAISSKEKRRLKRLKRQDRKEVADLIGDSVNNYLSNVTTVHTLQRF